MHLRIYCNLCSVRCNSHGELMKHQRNRDRRLSYECDNSRHMYNNMCAKYACYACVSSVMELLLLLVLNEALLLLHHLLLLFNSNSFQILIHYIIILDCVSVVGCRFYHTRLYCSRYLCYFFNTLLSVSIDILLY